jgi:taurine dioxygenase
MTLRISPIGGHDFAAVATGVDLASPIAYAAAESLRCAFQNHPVLIVRTTGLTPVQLIALAGVFGEPQVQLLDGYRMSATPTISIIASDQADTRGDGRKIVFGSHWHTDDSYLAVPAKATVLYAHIIPRHGGDTLFADTTAAYDALDSPTRAEVLGRRAVHTYLSRRNVSPVPTRSAREQAETPPVEHPLVRTDPATGWRSLYLNPNRMDRVVGLDDGASDELLDRLIAQATEDRFVYRHVWQPHDVVLWDNGRSMHRAVADYGDERREMHRVLLRGTVPV